MDLSKLGLTEQEYHVYKSILSKPPRSIVQLSKISGIQRGTLYSILFSLEEKKLIEKTSKIESNCIYRAFPPSRLKTYIEGKKDVINQEIQKLYRQLPVLDAISNMSFSTANLEIFTVKGKKAKDIINRHLETTNETITGYTPNHLTDTKSYYDFNQKGKLQMNGYMKTVLRVGDKFTFPGYDDSIMMLKHFLLRHPELYGKFQPRWIDPTAFSSGCSLFAFDDYTIYYDYNGKGVAYFIKNQGIATSAKSTSLLLWEYANPII